MKKMILALAAVSTLAVGLPAAAQTWDDRYDDRRYDDGRYEQPYDYQGYDRSSYGRYNGDGRWDVTDRLQMRIERSFRNGRITRTEYYSLRNQAVALERLEYGYMRDGVLTRWERDDLRRRANYIQNRLRQERQDRDWGFYR